MDSRRDLAFVAGLAAIALAAGIDLLLDIGGGAVPAHFVAEGLVVAVALGLIVRLVGELRRRRAALARVVKELEEAREHVRKLTPDAQVARMRLGEAIAQQFATWGLTESEREVGWLLLKGLTLKEIAAMRDTAEKTVRQHASAIYRKSGVSGRHAFAAWFIEDCL